MNARTTPRSDRVQLDPSIPRCEPSQHCPARHHCALYLAALPSHHASIFDASLDSHWSPSWCPHYVSAAARTRPTPELPRPKRRYWDH